MLLKLIENNQWSKIDINLDIISNPIYHNKYLIYYALINNKIDIIKQILELDEKNIIKILPDTFINIVKLDNFISILNLLEIVNDESKKYILQETNDDWILFYFLYFASIDNIIKLLKYEKYINWNILINDNYPLQIFLTRFYPEKNTSNDIKNILNIILSNSLSFIKNELKYINSIIIDSCLIGFNIEILDILYNINPECINLYNDRLITPLIGAIYNNNNELSKYLLNKKCNYNYYGSINAITLAVKNNNVEIIELLTKYKDIEYNLFDVNKWQLSHYIFSKTSKIPTKLKKIILLNTDNINLPNINGNTTLHLLFLYDNWKLYSDILELKILDLFHKNKLDLTPLDYFIKKVLITDQYSIEYELDDLMYIVSIAFINNINKISINNTKIKKNNKHLKLINIAQKCLLNKSYQCINNIGSNINKLKISTPKIDDVNIDFVFEKNIGYNLFISRDIDSFIYLLYFVNKYDVGIPVYNITNKSNKSYIKSDDESIDKILQFYEKISKEYPNLENLSIYWHDKNNYLIPNNLINALKKIKNKIIFIYITIVNENVDHANCIIIDINNKKIIHFEPYGSINKQNLQDLDSKLIKYFKPIYPTFTYFKPNDFMTVNSFQKLSNENNLLESKMGDIGGFCMAWCLWFFELFLRNIDIDLKVLVDKSIKKIISPLFNIKLL